MNPNNFNFPGITDMLNDSSNQIPGSSSANPNPIQNPNPNFPNFNPFNPGHQLLFQQYQLQQQILHTNLSQQQYSSYQQASQEIQEEDETEPVPTPTSKKPGSRGKRVKSMAKKTIEPEPQAKTVRVRNFWSQEEESLLAECFIHISKDPRVGSDQKNDTFWYKIRDAYNDQATKLAMSGENDENLMTRIEILYRAYEKTDFEHKSAWNFLKGKHKWNNPESTQARRNRHQVTDPEPELFGDDALPRPPGMHRIAKSQQWKEKMERIDREVNSRVALNDPKRVTEDLKVLQISMDGMDPIDAAIVNAQKARIRALYNSNN
nr:hypothetical protein [Tanacetum cinerariifolium]GEZ18798.1 hypothetical protein [Tanacetum cinerariifolium]